MPSYLPVPYNPLPDPLQQLAGALGPGDQLPPLNMGQATYNRPGAAGMSGMAGAGAAGGGWVNPPGVPGRGLLPTGASVGAGARGAIPNLPNLPNLSNIPNPSGLGAQGGSVVPQLASQVGGKGNLLSRMLGAGSSLPFPKSTTGRIGVGIGLPIAGNFLGDAAGGDDSMIGRFLKGAGAGGGLGALLGPKGAIVGGVVGGLGNAIFGGGEGGGDFEAKLTDILDQGNFSQEDAAQIRLMYSVLKEAKGEDAAKQEIGNIIVNDLMMREQAQMATQDAQSRMLATQALTAQFFQPFTQQLLDSAQQRYSVTEQVAETLPEAYRGVARAQNAASLDNATRTANAYAAQAQLLPAMAAMQQQQGLADQLAQQQAQTVIANLYGGGGGGGSLDDLLAQVGQ